jgi:hypothetical protein
MPNYISNTLTVTGPNPAAVITATTRKFTETEDAYKFEETGPDVSYYSDYAVKQLDPTFDPALQVYVFPDQQWLGGDGDTAVVSFESAWVAPWAGVARLSRLFPDNTLRLRSSGEMRMMPRIVLYSYKAGVETDLDPREGWTDWQKHLAAKYNAIVTSDIHRGGDKTAGTITLDGVKHEWTFIASSFGLPDGVTPGVIIPNVSLSEKEKGEVYEAVIDVLQAWPLDDEATVQDPLNEVVTA